MVSEDLKIREMKEGEKSKVLKVAKDSIPFFNYLITRANLYFSEPFILVAVNYPHLTQLVR